MLRGLYTATSAMTTNNKKMDVITNNLANINTTGYKKDLVISETFPEVLIKKINSPVDYTGREGFKGVEVNQEENGAYQLSTTGGFFRTKTLSGVSYEKMLNFAVNEDGYLSTYYRDQDGNIDTSAGYLVLGNRGPVYAGNAAVEVNERGQVLVDGNIVDNLVMLAPPPIIGTLNSGVRLDKIEINFDQGQIFETDNQLDFALKGRGFFQIETPEGVSYTRDGSFKINGNHELVTAEGYRVLGNNGPIVIDGTKVAVSEKGDIFADDEWMGQLNIIDIENLKDLRKEGGNLYKMAAGTEPEGPPFTGQVLQGFLENSNVDAVKEMIEMITLFRNYESNQKMIKAYDDTLQKVVNEVGKV
ncbi:flagellar hook-basal body protein [Geosporobacter ferrireducens]|uniref:Flagellar biosynthesis protein FlgE n=1 Tax=Geosporobacter ferrireducens TaxID=1424294 RepID=A0A1D8GGN2_9FIRM|nr:flagellar hook-basal body protein [Geosporobacter ferrireducens]AOT70059.1 flagellar biosynthesis protein FlgE [Geosporobacter ferrireducens]MTI53393.1 flagellar hook-basal body complex protein [Geosporobacter ferrireducens]